MNVATLIRELSKYPSDMEVFLLDRSTGFTGRPSSAWMLDCNEPEVEFLEGEIFESASNKVVVVG